MKKLKDLLNEAMSDMVYVVKDAYDNGILGIFNTEDEANEEVETRSSENNKLKLKVVKDKRTNYIEKGNE